MSRRTLDNYVEAGALLRVRHGVYAFETPCLERQLDALEMSTGQRIVACMSTAAAMYGFDVASDGRLHILDPGVRVRPTSGLMVHQRIGAPLRRVGARLATSPAWTAIEVARNVNRPRALAVLDAALRSGSCSPSELDAAIREQKGRRGIVAVRDVMPHADARAESAMESETRLVFIDGGLPRPELQYEIRDRDGRLWRVDFAWPDAMLVAEYESMEWHATSEALKHDRTKTARLQECGWTSIPIVVDDVRRDPSGLIARIVRHLDGTALAG